MPVPVALLVDDCSPLNPMHWHDPQCEHDPMVPNRFTRRFADVCAEHGAKGKFTVLPMPGGVGRIDRKLAYVPPRRLECFLNIVREAIAPRFDITPEILTHGMAYRQADEGLGNVREDEWVARASVDQIAEYVALSLRILDNVGLPASGVTSPWNTGHGNETEYAKSIAQAMWRVRRRKVSWYFLHVLGRGPARRPWVRWRSRRTGQVVVSVPATTDDPFWGSQRRSLRAARAAAREGVNALLTADGKGGRIRELFDQGLPALILTHWQSLYSEGTAAGLAGLDQLLLRVNRTFRSDLAWSSCSQLARRAAAAR